MGQKYIFFRTLKFVNNYFTLNCSKLKSIIWILRMNLKFKNSKRLTPICEQNCQMLSKIFTNLAVALCFAMNLWKSSSTKKGCKKADWNLAVPFNTFCSEIYTKIRYKIVKWARKMVVFLFYRQFWKPR